MNKHNYFFDTTSDEVCVVDKEGNFNRPGRYFRTLLGYSASDLTGKGLFDLVHPGDVNHTKAAMKSLAIGFEIVHFTNRCKMKSGRYAFLEWSVRTNADMQLCATMKHRSADTDGETWKESPVRMAIVRDLTENDGLASQLLTANQELIFQNLEKEKRALELLAVNNELIYQNAEKEKRALELVVANNELIFQNSEKEKRAIELAVANRELDFQSRERENRALELERAYQDLEKAENNCRKMNIELEQKVKERTLQLQNINNELEAFSYSVSHDLRAPIRAISGYTRIILEDHSAALDEGGVKALNSIIHNSKRMGELIDDLLAFSKLGRKAVRMSEINMAALVKSVLEELVAANSGNVPGLMVDALPPALGDQSLIKQVLVNLVSNAIKYSKYREKIRIHIGGYEKDGMTFFS